MGCDDLWMSDRPPVPPLTAQEMNERDEIRAFFDRGTGNWKYDICPLCGVGFDRVEGTRKSDSLLHIRWHQKNGED